MEQTKTATFVISRAGRVKWLHKPEGFREPARKKLDQLRRASIDSRDPTRYIVVSIMARVEDSGFGGHISMATLFKHRRVAEAVRTAIDGPKLKCRLRVVKVKRPNRVCAYSKNLT